MNKFVGSLIVGITTITGMSVQAEDSPHQISANVSLLTDYLYRGISQTNENFALQGGFDYTHSPTGFYVGTWASNIDFGESLEIDIYGGIGGEMANGISWDVGGLYYIYPGSNAEPEENFFEAYANLGYTFKEVKFEPSFGAGVAWSPDFFGEDGDGVYIHGNLDLSLPHDFGLSFNIGHQDVAGDKLSGPAGFDYLHYSIGFSKSLGPIDLSVSWNDANDDCDGGSNELCQAVVFSVGSSF
ncbi:MAG: hypothetical protein ACI9SC_002279 [Gammaproteobacteria bacterium]|jgi:uncharacterized protein (TIGR02001 family)